MKRLHTRAILLKRVNFSEADRILTVVTADFGKLSLFAKGVRKAKSKLAGGLELFSISEISFIDGRSELKTIVSTRLEEYFKNIVSDVEKTMAAYDFLKAIDKFSEHLKEKDVFDTLEKALRSLNDKKSVTQLVEVWFYSKLLLTNGNYINLEKPLRQKSFEENKLYDFSYDDMSFFESVNGGYKPNHIKFLRLVYRASAPEQLLNIVDFANLSVEMKDIAKQSAFSSIT